MAAPVSSHSLRPITSPNDPLVNASDLPHFCRRMVEILNEKDDKILPLPIGRLKIWEFFYTLSHYIPTFKGLPRPIYSYRSYGQEICDKKGQVIKQAIWQDPDEGDAQVDGSSYDKIEVCFQEVLFRLGEGWKRDNPNNYPSMIHRPKVPKDFDFFTKPSPFSCEATLIRGINREFGFDPDEQFICFDLEEVLYIWVRKGLRDKVVSTLGLKLPK